MADPITPSAAHLLALHDAVIGGAARALEQIWVELHRPLCQRLPRRFRTAPVDLIEDAATDAIRTYGVNPLAFDRTRDVPLDIFVYGIGVRLLRDRLRTEKRRAARETEYAARQVAYESADRATQCVLAHEMRSALRDVCDDIERGAPRRAWIGMMMTPWRRTSACQRSRRRISGTRRNVCGMPRSSVCGAC
jgi:hypothetical protein